MAENCCWVVVGEHPNGRVEERSVTGLQCEAARRAVAFASDCEQIIHEY